MGTVDMRIHHVDIEDGVVAVAEAEDERSLRLSFHEGGSIYDTDPLASYSVVLGGLTDYGCVTRAGLTDGLLTLELAESTVKSFGLDSAALSLRLEFEPDVVASLGRGFRTVFTSGPQRFRPVLSGDLAIEPDGVRCVYLYFGDGDFALGDLEEIVEDVVGDAGEVTGSGVGQVGGNLDIELWGETDLYSVLRTLAEELVAAGVPREAEFHLIGENRRVPLTSLLTSAHD